MRRPDYFYNKTATDLGIDEEIVKKVNRFFWKEVKDKIRNGENGAIYVKSLGTFYLLKRKVDKFLGVMIPKLREIERTEEQKERDVKFVKDLLILRNTGAILKYKVNKRKKEMNGQVS